MQELLDAARDLQLKTHAEHVRQIKARGADKSKPSASASGLTARRRRARTSTPETHPRTYFPARKGAGPGALHVTRIASLSQRPSALVGRARPPCHCGLSPRANVARIVAAIVPSRDCSLPSSANAASRKWTRSDSGMASRSKRVPCDHDQRHHSSAS